MGKLYVNYISIKYKKKNQETKLLHEKRDKQIQHIRKNCVIVKNFDQITSYALKEVSEKVAAMNQEFKSQIKGLKEKMLR